MPAATLHVLTSLTYRKPCTKIRTSHRKNIYVYSLLLWKFANAHSMEIINRLDSWLKPPVKNFLCLLANPAPSAVTLFEVCNSCTASQSMISHIKKLNPKKLWHQQEATFLSVSVTAVPIYQCRVTFRLWNVNGSYWLLYIFATYLWDYFQVLNARKMKYYPGKDGHSSLPAPLHPQRAPIKPKSKRFCYKNVFWGTL